MERVRSLEFARSDWKAPAEGTCENRQRQRRPSTPPQKGGCQRGERPLARFCSLLARTKSEASRGGATPPRRRLKAMPRKTLTKAWGAVAVAVRPGANPPVFLYVCPKGGGGVWPRCCGRAFFYFLLDKSDSFGGGVSPPHDDCLLMHVKRQEKRVKGDTPLKTPLCARR